MELKRLIELLPTTGLELIEDNTDYSNGTRSAYRFTLPGLPGSVCKIYDVCRIFNAAGRCRPYWDIKVWNFEKEITFGQLGLVQGDVIMDDHVSFLGEGAIEQITNVVKEILKLQRSLRKYLVDTL